MKNRCALLLRVLPAAWCILGLAPGITAQTGNIAVNATGAAADPKALLDVSSITKGLLVPRMASLPAAAGLPNGLTAFRTTSPRGFVTVDNGSWKPLLDGKNAWDIYGNLLANTANPSPDFIGTTDNQPLVFKTNGSHRMQIDPATGYLAVGHPYNATGAAMERMDINGALGMYYVPTSGEASNTHAPGVIRYQTFGTATGTAPYRYGTNEKPPTSPSNAATWNAVYGYDQFYPLQYAGHWGNVDGKDMAQGTATGTAPLTVSQPRPGGWRALENPYNEVVGPNWTHFQMATCGDGEATIPNGSAVPVWSNTLPTTPVNERNLVTPYRRPLLGTFYLRRQYLYFATELNLELARLGGNTTAAQGLCPGAAIDQVGFRVNATYTRPVTAGQAHIIVRNVVASELNGFDNTPDDSGTIGCGQITTSWPDVTGDHWQMVALNPPFIWDGHSNVLVEVAVSISGAIPETAGPVEVTQLPTNVTYSATAPLPSSYTPLPNPYPAPGWACPNLFSPVANNQLLMPDTGLTATTYVRGASKWRPRAKFHGRVTTAPPYNPPLSGTGSYITYPGALILEDSSKTGRLNSLSTGFPWGRWRTDLPPGYSTYNYKGNGTISAQNGVYDDGLRLNDHVFDRAFDGRVAPKEAAEFGTRKNLSMQEMTGFMEAHRHLPTMQGREAWDRQQGFSLGDLTNQLWTTAEAHALYVAELHDKLNVIELLTGNRPLNAAEFQAACRELAGMPRYSDAEKARLIAALRKRTPSIPSTP